MRAYRRVQLLEPAHGRKMLLYQGMFMVQPTHISTTRHRLILVILVRRRRYADPQLAVRVSASEMLARKAYESKVDAKAKARVKAEAEAKATAEVQP